MKRSEAINELATALAAAQGEIRAAPKDNEATIASSKGNYKYRYSTLADVWDACRAPLAKQGLSIVQLPSANGADVTLETILAHKSGQWISNELVMLAADTSPQKIGSAITYARRYALSAIVGVVSDEDDDGAEASGHQSTNTRVNPPRSQPPPAQPPASPAPAMNADDRKLSDDLRAAKSQVELDTVAKKMRDLPEERRALLRPVYVECTKVFAAATPATPAAPEPARAA